MKNKRFLLYPLLLLGLAVFVHLWITQPLFWEKIPYRLQAYKLAFTQVQCGRGAPAGLIDLLKYHALPNFALIGQVVYVESDGDTYACQVAPKGEGGKRYRLASMTKAVTAHTVLRLAEDGALDLDDHLLGYFPEVEVSALRDARLTQVTLSQLLNHSSGFGGAFGSDNMVKEGETPWCPHNFRRLETVRLAGQPGTNHVYSNVAYCLLGEVISRVTATSYRQYVREHDLAGTTLDFVSGPYLPDEPDYDFRNDFKLGRDYVNWLDFQALSSAAGLMGPPEEFARMVWRNFHADTELLLNGPRVPGCGRDKIDRCYSWNFELQRDEGGKMLVGIQHGYMPGVSSLLAITEDGRVLVWVAAGAPVLSRHKDDLKSAVVEFLQSFSKL